MGNNYSPVSIDISLAYLVLMLHDGTDEEVIAACEDAATEIKAVTDESENENDLLMWFANTTRITSAYFATERSQERTDQRLAILNENFIAKTKLSAHSEMYQRYLRLIYDTTHANMDFEKIVDFFSYAATLPDGLKKTMAFVTFTNLFSLPHLFTDLEMRTHLKGILDYLRSRSEDERQEASTTYSLRYFA